jgi:hypothetical protein
MRIAERWLLVAAVGLANVANSFFSNAVTRSRFLDANASLGPEITNTGACPP